MTPEREESSPKDNRAPCHARINDLRNEHDPDMRRGRVGGDVQTEAHSVVFGVVLWWWLVVVNPTVMMLGGSEDGAGWTGGGG